MQLTIPVPSLVMLIGPAGSGKTTFARRHFKPSEVLSSDAFRAMVGDDEANQRVSHRAFDVLYHVAAERLVGRRLAVIDATNVQRGLRRPLLRIARRYGVPAIAIVFDLPEATCRSRNRSRPERAVGDAVVVNQLRDLHRSMPKLADEGFAAVHVLSAPEAVDAVRVARERAAPTGGCGTSPRSSRTCRRTTATPPRSS